MPEVPYKPYADVTPTAPGAPELHPSVPSAAFGTNIADAVRSLGGDMDKVGGELFTRALAMQDLKNRADADEAMQNASKEQGENFANYKSQLGMDPQKNYPAFTQQQEDIRKKWGQNLNPAALRLYNSESRGFTARTIFSGAQHAGSEMKNALIKNADAGIDLAIKEVGSNPYDDGFYQDRMERARARSVEWGALYGLSPDDPAVQDKIQKAQSTITRARILAVAEKNTPMAQAMVKSLDSKLTDQDRYAVNKAVDGQHRAIATANITQQTLADNYDENGKLKKPLEEVIKDGVAQAGDDAVLKQQVARQIRAQVSADEQVRKHDYLTARQDLIKLIIDGKYRTEQELRTNPDARVILDGMERQNKKINVPGYIQKQIDDTFKEANQKAFDDTKQLYWTDRDKFFDLDFTQVPVNTQQRNSLEQFRSQVLRQSQDNPVFTRALSIMRDAHRAELSTLGILEKKQNPDDWNKYAGSLYGAIEAWRETHNRPPTEAEIRDVIGPEVIKSHTVPGAWWGTNQVPTYHPEDLPGFGEAREKWQKKYPNGTTEQFTREYNNELYRKLFGRAQKSDKGSE